MTPRCRKLVCCLIGWAVIACGSQEPVKPTAVPTGAPLPEEGSAAWKKIVEPRQNQLEKSIAGKKMAIARLPQGTVTMLDLPYVEHPIQSKFPGSGQTLDFYVPNGKGPFPLIVYIHGGAWKGGNKEKIGADLATEWVPQGFAIASLSYRFSYDAVFPGMFQDCIDAVAFLRKHAGQYNLNADKVGVCGNSAGGHIAALVGMAMGGNTYANCEKPVQALVMWCGYGDVTKETGNMSGGFPHIYPNRAYDPEIARKISPIYQIHPGIPPVLAQHGEKDRAVLLAQPRAFVEKLKKDGYDATLITYPDYQHDLWKPDVHEAALAFFKKHLQ